MNKPWAVFSVKKAREAQKRISSKVIEEDFVDVGSINSVCGLDVAYSGNKAVGACVCLRFSDLNVIDRSYATIDVRFPYIPTLLSFREAPAMYLAVKKLKLKPDLIMVNGHGLLHPYKCGIATHLGVVLNTPSIGVAKRRLYGSLNGILFDGVKLIIDENGKSIGAEVRREGFEPIYVSVGNKIRLESAVRIALKLLRKHRLPEPLRLAHEYATKLTREFKREK
ncbi:MAG: endonuclease V [Candidatus Methanomethylicota archaeon]|uniref:Endonuclease V n=1 Tax=Thermoproteota archaeon TaxID=2056631 RepID=A0A497ETP1_9CREN|nr:MAG: endonuclease V [Candidatus Verstraetearchaeota archaeon]RLE52343.1 MAG: endonuclease V [Candidatus Verstraetearchaeota archaeon]